MAIYSGLMPNGSRDRVTVRRTRSWMAMPYMPRSCFGVVRAVAQPQMQRRLAVAVGGEVHARQRLTQFAVIIDLAVGHQRGGAGEERLVAGDQVDDREAVVQQRDPAHHRVAAAVGAAVVQRADQLRQHARVRRRGAGRQDQPSDAAHMNVSESRTVQIRPRRPPRGPTTLGRHMTRPCAWAVNTRVSRWADCPVAIGLPVDRRRGSDRDAWIETADCAILNNGQACVTA